MIVVKKTVIYGRVSTKHEAQFYSFDNQVQYYDRYLGKHDDWILHRRYFDKGITGTSTKKRKAFLAMIDDAKKRDFDILITREVSRFARNVRDAINVACDLVDLGIRVIFIINDIDTERDNDWKEKLVSYAVHAENQSKSTSEIVRSGQETSRINGVLYGTGNVLGYDRVGREFVINEIQAKTVRLIFDMYLRGNGSRKIQYELERCGYLTASGKNEWDAATITRILKNPLYCGRVVYNKYYVDNFLKQQPKINKGEVEQVIIEDRVEPIVTKEEFSKVQELLERHKTHNKGTSTLVGKHPVTIFGKKLKCSCGYSMQKKTYHKHKDGHTTWCYQCYDQVNRGSYSSRKKNGVKLDGVCETKMIPDWKLKLAAYVIFDMLIDRKDEIISNIESLLKISIGDEKNVVVEEQEFYEKEIEAMKRKISKLMDLYSDDYITLNEFNDKKAEINITLNDYIEKLNIIKSNNQITPKTMSERLEECKNIITDCFTSNKNAETYELLVDSFVDKIVVSNEKIEWYMKLTKEITYGAKTPLDDVIREKEVFIGTLLLTKDDATYYSKYCNDLSRVYFDKPLLVDIYVLF